MKESAVWRESRTKMDDRTAVVLSNLPPNCASAKFLVDMHQPTPLPDLTRTHRVDLRKRLVDMHQPTSLGDLTRTHSGE
ncbi:hypothetical protein J6590_045186 [Homalodisca vitripennis]|nr:hypothetical protein J6590_045186 [Homalodisca vitripennis]